MNTGLHKHEIKSLVILAGIHSGFISL